MCSYKVPPMRTGWRSTEVRTMSAAFSWPLLQTQWAVESCAALPEHAATARQPQHFFVSFIGPHSSVKHMDIADKTVNDMT